jgi:hypothetical protein
MVISNVVALLLLQTGAFTPSWVVFKNIEGLTIHIIIYIVGLCTSQTPPCRYIVYVLSNKENDLT